MAQLEGAPDYESGGREFESLGAPPYASRGRSVRRRLSRRARQRSNSISRKIAISARQSRMAIVGSFGITRPGPLARCFPSSAGEGRSAFVIVTGMPRAFEMCHNSRRKTRGPIAGPRQMSNRSDKKELASARASVPSGPIPKFVSLCSALLRTSESRVRTHTLNENSGDDFEPRTELNQPAGGLPE
jgi:hypothetical protein